MHIRIKREISQRFPLSMSRSTYLLKNDDDYILQHFHHLKQQICYIAKLALNNVSKNGVWSMQRLT